MIRLLTLLLLVVPFSASAETTIYRETDPSGAVSFSDSPMSEDAEAITVQQPQAVHNPNPASAAPPQQKVQKKPVKRQVRIVSPSEDQAISHGGGQVTVTVDASPKKANLRLSLNGNTVYQGAFRDSIDLENISRGTHTLRATLESKSGKALAQSGPVVFHMIRPIVRNRP